MRGIRPFVAICLIMSILTSGLVGAQTTGVDYTIDHSDPASDVEWLYPNGTKELNDGPKNVNLKRIRSEDLITEVKVWLELASPGLILDHPNATYSVLIATVNNTTADLIVNYTQGSCEMWRIAPNEKVEADIKCQLSGGKKAGEALVLTIPKTALGEPQVFELAGKARYHDEVNGIGNVTYSDYVWSLSGNPGSTPTDPTEPDGKGSGDQGIQAWMVMTAIVVILIAALAVGLIYFEHRKRGAKQQK